MKIRNYHGQELEVTPGLSVVKYDDGFLQDIVRTHSDERSAISHARSLNDSQKLKGFIINKIRYSVFR